MLRTTLLGRDGTPLDAGGERRATPARQARVGDCGTDALGTERDRCGERVVAAVLAVRLEGGGVDHTDPLQQAQRLVALLMEQRVGLIVGGHSIGATDALDENGDLARGLVGPLALTEAGRLVDVDTLRLQLGDAVGRAGDLARGVDAHMGDVAGLRRLVGSEQVVERGDAVRLRRRNLQRLADVVEPARADPTLGVLQRVQCRQQEMTMAVALRGAGPDEPFALAYDDGPATERGVDRRDLDVVRRLVGDVQISHSPESSPLGWPRP